jgi:hypothetical protein
VTPREYTLYRIILLGIEIKGREGRDDHRVQALRNLYKELKTEPDIAKLFGEARRHFIGLDLIHFDRILVDEVDIKQLARK